MPSEIHRAVRQLDTIRFWKALEFKHFLLYYGFVILKDVLPSEVYCHFLLLFSAIRILSCQIYIDKFMHIAETFISTYLEQYLDIYGCESITSNVHNLCHLIDDVKRFGALLVISTYPFENLLHETKLLLRNGHKPLAQIAKRLSEISSCDSVKKKEVLTYPILTNETNLMHEIPNCRKKFCKILLNDNFALANDKKNKYFLTIDNKIVAMKNATYFNDKIHIFGESVKYSSDFFVKPFLSSYLDIYSCKSDLNPPMLYPLENIKCKMVSLTHENQIIFVPLLHTINC